MPFNMNRTWSQAIALARANGQLLAIIAGVFLLLPSLVFAIAMPQTFDWARLSENPDAAVESMNAVMVPLLTYSLVALVLQFIGYGAMVALMGDDRPTVGEAIARGFRSLPTMIAATLLFILAYVVLAVVLALLIGVIAGVLGTGGVAVVGGVLGIMLLGALFYVMTRLSLTMPVVVLDAVANPVRALRRSWALTKPHGGAIFGFYVLLAIAYIVLSMLLFGLVGVLAAAFGEGPAAALFTGLVNGVIGALVAMVLSGILVSMHQQLAGRPGAAVSETFS